MTSCSGPVFDMTALEKSEQASRRILENEPGDTATRLKLAWCLTLQAVYRAGQEEEQDNAAAPPVEDGRDAGTLLNCGLQQAVIVLHLSDEPRERREAEQLRTLATRCGAGNAVAASDAEAERVLSDLTEAIFCDGKVNRRRIYRNGYRPKTYTAG